MIVYVMRHAEAVEAGGALQDEWRYLTEKGRQAAELVSAALVKHGPKPRLTITSPLTRAVQTAEIAAAKACRRNLVMASSLLLPGGDIDELVRYLKGCADAKRILLVGHEPQLGNVVARLLGRPGRAMVLKKGACVALKYDAGKGETPAEFLWYQLPGKKPVTSLKKAFPRS